MTSETTGNGTGDNGGTAFEDAIPFGPEANARKKTADEAADLEKNAPLVSSFLGESLKEMGRRARGESVPVSMPWKTVSNALGGGLWPGLHVLTGATGTGKTQFALQVAWQAAKSSVPVLYIGLELGRIDLAARLLALAEGDATGRTPRWSDLFLGTVGDHELERLSATHGATIEALPFRAEFGPPHGWGADVLSKRVAAIRAEAGPNMPLLVVLDYLQAVGDDKEGRRDLRERIGRAAYAGRAVARDLGAAVLMLSSVSRENAKMLRVKTSESKDGLEIDSSGMITTSPSDLAGLGKESGEIEFSADTVLALASEPYDERTHERVMHLAVAKLRAGRPSWQRLTFNGSTFAASTEWEDVTPTPEPKTRSGKRSDAPTRRLPFDVTTKGLNDD